MDRLNYFEKKQNKKKSINLVPLINIIFLLLIFFMLSGTIAKKDLLKITPPKSKNSTSDIKKDIEITITRKNDIYINERLIELENTGTFLIKKYPDVAKKNILIRADLDASSHALVNTINILKKNNFTKISILTKTVK